MERNKKKAAAPPTHKDRCPHGIMLLAGAPGGRMIFCELAPGHAGRHRRGKATWR